MNLPAPASIPSRFVLLDRLAVLEDKRIAAVRRFADAPLWQGVEALAQLAALHQRWSREFGQQAFLLSIQTLEASAPLDALRLSGECGLEAGLLARTEGAAQYRTLLHAPAGGKATLRMLLHIGVRPFQDAAQAEPLRRRYMEIFQCLRESPSV